MDDEVLGIDVVVPGGTTAEVVTPDGRSTTYGPGAHHVQSRQPA